MAVTVEAMIDEMGEIRLLEPIRLPIRRRALVTVLDEAPQNGINGHATLTNADQSDGWDDLFQLMDEIAAEDSESVGETMSEAFLKSRR